MTIFTFLYLLLVMTLMKHNSLTTLFIPLLSFFLLLYFIFILKGCCGRMIDEFTTTCAINVFPHQSCDLASHSWRSVLDTTLCDQVCQ
jgi:hypothetical protein